MIKHILTIVSWMRQQVQRYPRLGVPGLILGLIVLYFMCAAFVNMIRGLVKPPEIPTPVPSVRVTALIPQEKEVTLNLKGLVEPSKLVTLRPRVEGVIQEIRCKEGDFVQKGQVLALMTTDQRAIQMAQAEADVKHRQLELKVAQSLAREKLQSDTGVAKARTAFEQSQLGKKRAQLDLDFLKIKAPFEGYVGEIVAWEGTYINPYMATGVLSLADMNPAHVVCYVTEKDYPSLSVGLPAQISDGRGHAWTGDVYALSPLSDEQTRSYKLEIRCRTPLKNMPQGMTVQVQIQQEKNQAYAMALSWLSLDDQGVWGVKVVNEQQQVQFFPVTLVTFDTDRVWVRAEGLPQPLQLITVGHGFVNPGQKVNPIQGQN